MKLFPPNHAYAVFGVFLLFDAWIFYSLAESSSSIAKTLARNVSVPWMVMVAVGYLLLSGASLAFMRLTKPWRIVTIVLSLAASTTHIVGAARTTVAIVPVYLAHEPTDYLHLVIQLALYWGLALILCLCSYLLWKQLLASNNRWRARDV